ncbi:MAG: Lrp/AsnC family transcriptional regulator [Eubacteriales bacterium]|jgi:Lrp/AsnC family leucine-responsive transcriptional regulator|nr:Lrp/AsnC family transcriptional regulator [Eubacteriales bacterium]
MDDLDKKILGLLSQNGRMPASHIAEVVHLSPQAVTARIERLENQNVINGYQAVINPEKLGNVIQAIVTITIKSQLQADFINFVQNQACVTECHHVTGAYSMIVKISVPAINHLDNFVRLAQKYGDTQSLLVLSSPVKRRYNYDF